MPRALAADWDAFRWRIKPFMISSDDPHFEDWLQVVFYWLQVVFYSGAASAVNRILAKESIEELRREIGAFAK